MRKTLILVAAVSLIAGQAAAHARLITGVPKAGATVAAPKQLRLTYSESLDVAGSSVKVSDTKGAAVGTGPLTLDPKNKRIAIVPLTAPLAAGAYKVNWSMKTEDGHTTTGDFGFKVK